MGGTCSRPRRRESRGYSTSKEENGADDVVARVNEPTNYIHSGEEYWDAVSELDSEAAQEGWAQPVNHCTLSAALQAAQERRALAAHSLIQQLDQTLQEEEDMRLSIQEMSEHARWVMTSLRCLQDDSGYSISRQPKHRHDLEVLYKHESGNTIHHIKLKATFQQPAEHLLAMIYEFDLIPTWNSYSLESRKLTQDGGMVYGAIWGPPPFRGFHSVIEARGFDLGEELQSLLVAFKTPTDASESELLARVAEEGSERHRCLVHKRRWVHMMEGSCIMMQPLDKQTTEAKLLLQFDPHIPYVPGFLVNFVLGIMAPFVFHAMCVALDNAFKDGTDSPLKKHENEFPARLAAQPEIYQVLQSRVNEVLFSK